MVLATRPAAPSVLVRGDQLAIPCVFMRGGTSRGAFLRQSDLPTDRDALAAIVLAIYGSPDERQIDGIGGADPLTSKVAIIGPSSRPDADVDYTFGQVRVAEPVVDWDGNCGNMSAAVGPFAIDEGLVAAREPVTRVRIHNTNTGKVLVADVPVANGKALADGDCAIPGVPGTGARVWLDFGDAAGSMTGGIFPTGSRSEALVSPSGRSYTVSLVDVSNPCVFVRAAEVGLLGTESPRALEEASGLLQELEGIRSAAAARLCFVSDPALGTSRSPAVPKLCMVASSRDYRATGGQQILASDVTLVARSLVMQRPHPAYQVTAATCTAVAARLVGTVVNEVAAGTSGTVRIGHPSGIMSVDVAVEEGAPPRVLRAAQERTARRIMDGHVYVPLSRLPALHPYTAAARVTT